MISLLKNDGIGVLPTDTLYGIVGSAFSEKAIDRIYALKGRDENKPFIILISSPSDLVTFGIKLSASEQEFLHSVWPGPVSVILPCPLKKYAYLHRGTESLAFRVPKSRKLRTFLEKTGPLVAPSANMQGQPPASIIREAKRYFGDKADFYIAAGKKEGKPSKLVSLLSENPKILRP